MEMEPSIRWHGDAVANRAPLCTDCSPAPARTTLQPHVATERRVHISAFVHVKISIDYAAV